MPHVSDVHLEHAPTPTSLVAITYTCQEATAHAWLQAHVPPGSTTHVGVDAEWRPVFRPGAVSTLAALQVATPRAALVVQLNALWRASPSAPAAGALVRFLESGVVFCGMGVHGDLQKVHELLSGGSAARPSFRTVDLKRYGQDRGVNVPGGLAGLAAHVVEGVHRWKSRKLQMSNWAAYPLTPAQLRYAAMDAWASLACWEALSGRLPLPPSAGDHWLGSGGGGGGGGGGGSSPARGSAALPPPSPAAAAARGNECDDAELDWHEATLAAYGYFEGGARLSPESCRAFLGAVLARCRGAVSDKVVQLLLPRAARPAGCRTLAALASACGLETDRAATTLYAPDLFPADAPPRCDLDDVATVGRLLHLNGLDRIPASDWGAAFPPDSRPLEFRNKARQLAEACGFRTLDADGMGGYSVELGDA